MSTFTNDSSTPAATPLPRRRKKNSEAKLFLFLGGIVVVLGGLYAFISQANTPAPYKAPPPPKPLSVDTMAAVLKGAHHSRGPENAPITIVEFADVQCPVCRRAYAETISKLEKRPDVRLVFRHLPITDMHERAVPAIRALEAADKQGKFWEMYDALFAGGEKAPLDDKTLEEKATAVGLNLDKYRNDIKDDSALSRIEEDHQAYKNIADSAITPTFLVRDTRGGKVKVTRVVGNREDKNTQPYLMMVLENKPIPPRFITSGSVTPMGAPVQ